MSQLRHREADAANRRITALTAYCAATREGEGEVTTIYTHAQSQKMNLLLVVTIDQYLLMYLYLVVPVPIARLHQQAGNSGQGDDGGHH